MRSIKLLKSQSTVQILLPIAVDRPFDYAVSGDLHCDVGDMVEVPFRGKTVVGVVWGKETTAYSGKLKEVIRKVNLPTLSRETLEFVTWVAGYNLAPLGMVLKMVLPVPIEPKTKARKSLEIGVPNLNQQETVSLSSDQEEAAEAIQKAIATHSFQPFLLDGVTGSGKTEVYLSAMAEALKKGQQIVVLLPEIALTTQWLDRFQRRFGAAPLQWHSGLSPVQRQQTWTAILEGRAPVIVGARSALFLPFPNLGLIIVDEEHDPSYKQEEQVIYQARDMAVVRAKLSKIPIVLVSATPSLETVTNVEQGRYQHLVLKNRHGGANMPTIRAIDMRLYPHNWISPPLQDAITKALEAKEQVMLFLNRRGYAPLTLCRGCGHRLMCPTCTSWLVEHKRSSRLQCHQCGYCLPLPKVCPECKAEESLIACGPGVERIFEQITQTFPKARCEMLTSDMMSTPKHIHELIRRVTDHEVDIIIGTQILAKGHHFPMMTLVGVVDADLGLSGGDLRACERTYQLLHQVSGRAGREQRPGRVLLQTFNPEHPVMAALVAQDRDGFVDAEKYEREARLMPPFGRLGAIIVSGPDATRVEQVAKNLARSAPHHPDFMVLGPVPAPLAQLRGRHRWRLLVKTTKSVPLQQILSSWVGGTKSFSNVRVTVDIDPYSFL
ncbi:MAG: primosomal protein N' [Alphaproteobacteria bacterium]|nr:primosomal protein N' [Alphaproteobacteria bacterium]